MFDYSVSIIIPTYNRKKFEKLIEYNINIQDYPCIEGVYIADDSDTDEALHLNIPYNIHYYKTKRCTIGEKRHFLNNISKGKYIINFDTDDFYKKDYISTSIFTLIDEDKGCCGSADMIIYNNKDFYKQRCIFLYMLNEGTMCMTKEFYDKSTKYIPTNSNESMIFLKENINDICETKESLMCCLGHDKNTIDKSVWYKPETLMRMDETCRNEYKSHIELLSTLNIYEPPTISS